MNFNRLGIIGRRLRKISYQPTYHPIFVFGCSHRCGSTLLQRLLNSAPQILIWGEHNGYLNDFFWSLGNLRKWAFQHNEERLRFFESGYDHFLANMSPDDESIQEASRAHLISLFALPAAKLGRKIWGFKEVRYGMEVALALQELFPEMRLIHLVRHPVDVYLSLKNWEKLDPGWDHVFTEQSMNNWIRINRGFIDAKDQIDSLLQVKFEEMIADPGEFIRQLARFLNIPARNFRREVFTRKLANYEEPATRVKRSKPTRSDLSEKDKDLLGRAELHEIASAYGYHIEF